MSTHRRTGHLARSPISRSHGQLAAPLRGIVKDELIGEDIRQHRRLNSWRNAVLGVVTTLLMAAIAAAAIAIQQRQTAIALRDQAQRNESRAIAGLAENEVERGSSATAIRLALAASYEPERAEPCLCTSSGKERLHSVRYLRAAKVFPPKLCGVRRLQPPTATPSLPAQRTRQRGCGR